MDTPRMAKPTNISIGTSGWHYSSWKERFYDNLPKKQWLPHYAEHFSSAEVNASYYRRQSPQTLEQWSAITPEPFAFCLKGHRHITHNLKLSNPLPSLLEEKAQLDVLGDKLKVMLWQLPEKFEYDLQKLQVFAQALENWREVRHVIEFRHPSWFREEVEQCLTHHHLINCLSDAADWPLWDAITSDIIYIRLHGHTRTYESSYSKASLQAWAKQIRTWKRQGKAVYCFFDNGSEDATPKDALKLGELLKR